MKVLNKTILSDGTKIQVEDWSKDWTCYSYGETLAAYPESKVTLEGSFSPNFRESFRCQFNFKSHEQALQAYNELLEGVKVLSDFSEFLKYPEYAVCI